MKTLKIIGLSIYDDDYENTDLHKFCINSWNKLILYCKKSGYNANIKIYKHNHILVKIAKFLAKKHLKSKSKSICTDAIKCFFLGTFSNVIFLDLDVYVKNNINFNFDFLFRRSFYFMSNINNKFFYKKLFKRYCNGDFINKMDYYVFSECNLPNTKPMKEFKHLHMIDNCKNLIYTDDANIIDKYKNNPNVAIITHNINIHRAFEVVDDEDKYILRFINTLDDKIKLGVKNFE